MEKRKIKVEKNKRKETKKSLNNFVITKDTKFIEVLEKKPESFNLLFQSGLHCLGCGMSAYETIEQGCLAHGMSKKEIDNLIKKINIL